MEYRQIGKMIDYLVKICSQKVMIYIWSVDIVCILLIIFSRIAAEPE